MKKNLISIFLVFVLLICTAGCSGKKPGTSTDNPPATSQTIYEKLNDMAKKTYTKVKVNILTTTNGVQLAANYELTKEEVVYLIEQLTLLPENGVFDSSLSSYKTTVSGSAKIKNGQIILNDGSNVSVPSYDELVGKFHFNESNFKNIVFNSDSMKAEVISPSQFYGASVAVKNMTIDINYSNDSFVKISISYQTEKSNVQTVYFFEP